MRIRLALCLALICAALIWHNSPRSMLQAVAQSALPGNSVATTSMGAAVDQFLTVADVTLRYREVGRGEPVILIHGYARNIDDWARVADALASTHRVLAIDVRGFGKSSKFADPRRFGALMADDVIRLFDHLRISRAHVVGQSMGALIAAKVAAQYPTRVSTATLIAGPFYNAGAKSEAEILAGLKAGKGMTQFLQRTFPEMDAMAATEFSAKILAQNESPVAHRRNGLTARA